MSKLQVQSTSCPNSVAQHAAVEALNGAQSQVRKMGQVFDKRRKLIIQGLNQIDGIVCEVPNGAFYVFPDISRIIGKTYKNQKIQSSSDLSLLLLKEKYIVTVSGDAFGAPNNIRFSYATSDEIIKTMLKRLAEFCSLLK